MAKLSLNKAAKEASVAKSTLLQALNSKRMSAEKNEKGHWEIDTAELDRVFGKKESEPVPTSSKNGSATPENTNSTSALEVEVKMLREQMGKMEQMHDRERGSLEDQVSNLREQMERQSVDHRQALAAITDQRPEKRGWFTFGRKAG